ncbi:DUF418 domain-containing protein [Promicromonospora thailandica]|uniref:Membrane protein YeiB n=1 Tax=Promicromonospora thailandica TaxID=765201 RepID=A0A9X2G8G9_9MICO|nr:DUF418 domain-containing protein [Promicromonospora thailandica]MCP2263841.1 putative membrane protein YeiB [Promicromonospora thailandica]BFF17863.1 DUF418 domain-containing protein [Promicromonospora thailandica]
MPTSALARGPVQAAERSPAPDLARGLMLLLIAVANTPYYLWGSEMGVGSSHPVDGTVVDRVAAFLVIVLVDLRTYPMFAFLFGYGMMQLYNRQTASGTPPEQARRLLQRRNWLLLGFGLVHAALLWMGDVLGAYGLAGLLVVWLFFEVRDRTLIVWTAVLGGLLTVGTLLAVVGAFFVARLPADDPAARELVASFGPDTSSMTSTSYLASISERLVFWMLGTVGQGVLMLVVPMMLLLAFWAGRRRILENPGGHLPLLRRVTVVGLAVGWLGPLPSALDHVGVLSVPDHAAWVFLPVQIVTGFFGGLGYVALFGLIGHRVAQRRTGAPSRDLFRTDGPFAGAVQAVGKRSLTSYLLQSVLCAPVLAAWGLGLGQHLSSWSMVLYAVGVWGLTVLFAVWQERTGRRGPAEVALRRLVYGRPRTV